MKYYMIPCVFDLAAELYASFSFAVWSMDCLTASATLRFVKCYYGMLGWKILPIGIFRSAKFNQLNSKKKV